MARKSMMGPEDVKARVAKIAALNDDEIQHCREDELYCDVLRAISRGECDDPARCAYEALKSQALTFERWCA